MRTNRLLIVGFGILLFVISSAGSSQAGNKLYEGSWIAESFGNDRAGIGTEESQYFEVTGIPLGVNCHPNAPLCDISSTPVTTTGSPTNPGANGNVWNPVGPGCRPLTAGEKPRPAKNGTLTTGDQQVPGIKSLCPGPFTPLRPHTRQGFTTTVGAQATPCNKTPPLYRNKAFFTLGGAPDNQTCEGNQTVLHTPACTNCKTTAYLAPGDARRGILMKGAPLTGSGNATTTASNTFRFPAAAASSAGPGMRRTTQGSFIGEGPYLYSYTYANLRNDAGTFGPGKGFFSLSAVTATLQFQNKAGGGTVGSVKVKRGANRFGGVMKLLGTYRNKVCYFYGGGCGLGIGTWGYQDIGTAGYKKAADGSPIVTRSWTTSFLQVYYNTALSSFAKYDVIEQRFPWTTGTVTVTATGRGPNKTFEQRKGFDNRVNGVGTVQLVSPTLTQWLGQFGAAAKFETGGIGVMKIKFIPEPGGAVSLIAGASMLWLLSRFRR
ncbi:MAG: hypothetical protein JRG94_16475 [Deltaproteobacteria bacterium]|nr:hypothetical protein [Deltaproteobacteria bacterium]